MAQEEEEEVLSTNVSIDFSIERFNNFSYCQLRQFQVKLQIVKKNVDNIFGVSFKKRLISFFYQIAMERKKSTIFLPSQSLRPEAEGIALTWSFPFHALQYFPYDGHKWSIW